MSDISKAELKKEIQAILKDADLDNTSAKKVRLELQEKLDVDLTERKKEVDQLVMEVIDEQTQEEDGEDEDDEDEDEDEEDEDEEEEEQKKPVKRPAPKPQARDDSGSENEEPSDGGGSDYEPDEPVKVNKPAVKRGGKKATAAKKKTKYGSDDDESSGEEWGKAKKRKSTPKKRKGGSDSDSDYEKPKKKKRGGGGGGKNGWTAPLKLSEELADVVGGNEMPRHEVVKRMWAYIKENKLQDPKNKQFVKCDDKLSKVFPTKKFRGFGMTKFLKDHMNVD